MKYILKRIYILTLMMILSIFMVALCVNVKAEVYGNEVFESEGGNTEKFWEEVNEKSKTLDMFEIESMREENVKHYKLPNGNYRAISFDRPIHMKDEKGNWQEIDNTLIFDGKNYETKDKRVSFSKDISKDAFFMKYAEGDSAINFKIINDKDYSKNEAIVNNYNNIESLLIERSSEQIYNIENYSTINYSNIFDNTSLECLLDYKTVVNKIRFESIENSHNISLLINVTNLRVELDEGNLMFYNLKNGTLEYKMLQPYVKYNNNIDNTVSQYKLVKTDKDGYEYKLTIEIDLSKYELKEDNGEQMRLLPNGPEIVIVGPIDGGGGGGGSSTPAVYDTYVSSSNANTNYGSSPEVKISAGNAQIGYFKIYEPAIPDGSTITDAFFRIPYYFTTSNSNYINVGAYQIMENWSESSVSWSSNINVSNVRLSNAYTYASATESNPEYVILGIGDAAKSWYSRSTNNYGIAVKYENGNASTVLMKSWESHAERTTMTIDYSMDELIVKEGTYFIKNGHLDKYIQIDDGDSDNSYATEDAILEVWTGTGVSFQKWIFEYLHNGYYKIKSYRSGKVISVKEGNEDESNDALVQQIYDGSDRQQWKITSTSSGKYKIKAKSSENYSTDRVMCIGEGIGGNGRNVEQREYSNNNTFKDEWYLEKVDATVKLIAVNETDIIRNSFFDDVANIITTVRTNDISSNYYEGIGKDLMIHYLDNSKIVFAHTHGEQNKIYCGSNAWVTSSDLISIDLSNLEIALLMTCNTGVGGYDQSRVTSNSPINIVERMICCGAETVVGFSKITYVDDCNVFAVNFAEQTMNNHLSIQNAINAINYSSYIQDMSSIAVIGGNVDNQIWN